MHELALPEVFAAAARATINERCAPAYLHDIRGTMQALFSALELLGRSAKSGGDAARVEKACDLARRAISRHEKSTMEVLQLLTSQHAAATAMDLGVLVSDVVHFLRNDAVTKEVIVTVSNCADLNICAERAKLQVLLVGLLTAEIDAAPPGSELRLSVERRTTDALLSIGSEAGYDEIRGTEDLWQLAHAPLSPKELTLLFARQFLTANGGRLEFDRTARPQGSLHLYYPLLVSDEAVLSLPASSNPRTSSPGEIDAVPPRV